MDVVSQTYWGHCPWHDLYHLCEVVYSKLEWLINVGSEWLLVFHVPMPTQPSSLVPHGPLFTSFRRCFLPASTFGQQSPTLRTMLPAQHVRPSGVFCCWPDCLEVIALKTFGIQSVMLTVTDSRWRHFYFCSTSVFSALEFFYVNALYKFTFDFWHSTVYS